MSKVLVPAVFLILFSIFFISLGGDSEVDKEELLEEICNAIRDNDWPAYRRHSLVPAEIYLRRMKISPLKAGKTFAGSSLLPLQQEILRADFERAVAGGEGMIDFTKVEFISIGQHLYHNTVSLFNNCEYDYDVYSVVIDVDGEQVDSKNLWPCFRIVRLNDRYYLTSLIFENS